MDPSGASAHSQFSGQGSITTGGSGSQPLHSWFVTDPSSAQVQLQSAGHGSRSTGGIKTSSSSKHSTCPMVPSRFNPHAQFSGQSSGSGSMRGPSGSSGAGPKGRSGATGSRGKVPGPPIMGIGLHCFLFLFAMNPSAHVSHLLPLALHSAQFSTLHAGAGAGALHFLPRPL